LEVESFEQGFAALSSLCEESINQRSDITSKANLIDQALCYFDHLKLELKSLDLTKQGSEQKASAMVKIAHDLSALVSTKYMTLMSYDGMQPCNWSDDEVEIEDMVGLFDLILFCEIVCLSLLANDVKEQEEVTPQSISYSEALLRKLEGLTLSEKLHKDNKTVTANLQMRSESGLF
jgi:hypothetical protein